MTRHVFATKGSRYNDKDAQVVDHFCRKNFQPWQLDAKSLLKIAPRSSIARYFEWDDKIAGQKFRLRQAQSLLSMVTVIIEDVPIRAYQIVYINKNVGKKYTAIEDIMQSEDLFDQILGRAYEEMKVFILKYENYKKLKPVVGKMKTFLIGAENAKKENNRKKTKVKNKNRR